MAVLYYDFPDIRPDSVEWTLVPNNMSSSSVFTNQSQIIALTGDKWRAKLNFSVLPREELLQLFAFLAKLRGEQGLFLLWDHSIESSLGSIVRTAHTPLTYSTVSAGNKLWTHGWGTAETGLFKVGEYVGYVDSNEVAMLHTITGSYVIDANGLIIDNDVPDLFQVNDTVTSYSVTGGSLPAETYIVFRVEPPIRKTPITDDPLVYGTEKPKAVMKLPKGKNANKRVTSPVNGAISMEFEECVFGETV